MDVVICCQCGEPVRGAVHHDAAGHHNLHFGCRGSHFANCHCEGYPLMAASKQQRRVGLGDITNRCQNGQNIHNGPCTSPSMSGKLQPRFHPRLELSDMDISEGRTCIDSRSPSMTSTSPGGYSDNSPGSSSDHSFLDAADLSMDDGGILAKIQNALSGESLCEIPITSESCSTVIGLKMKIEDELHVPVSQQELLHGSDHLSNFQSLDSVFHQVGRSPSRADYAITLNLIKKTTTPRPAMELLSQSAFRNRCSLVDWLIRQHARENLTQASLYFAINLVDAFLSHREELLKDYVEMVKVGIAALRIASTTKDDVGVSIPRVSQQRAIELARETRLEQLREITAEELLRGERDMLHTLDIPVSNEIAEMNVDGGSDFNGVSQSCNHATVNDFLTRFSNMAEFSPDHLKLIAYFAEHCLFDVRMLRHDPSRIAAAAVLCSNRKMRWQNEWPPAVANVLPYSERSLQACTEDLRTLVYSLRSRNSEYNALREKYQEVLTRLEPPSQRARFGGA